VERLGLVASRAGHAARAARLLGAVAAWHESRGYEDGPLWRRVTAAMIAPARAALGEEAWAATWAVGQAMTLEEAIAEALSEEPNDA
jgi:hypothetical protein